MYYIRKTPQRCYIRNHATGMIKELNEGEVNTLMQEFPFLRLSKTVTYFRNRVKSIPDLP
ncbi:MAG: hypothetical protein D6722_19450 [Bacteroidetes bacterium]|nr:MAG: hypothetical protein D6722_19450 [Bacteroidota bacterium]